MQAVTTLVAAVSALLWPVIVVGVLVIFHSPIRDLIGSAKSRKITIKIGGQELTMDEATEQQSKLIANLQSQIADIQGRLAQVSPAELSAQPSLPAPVQQLSSVLWVDDEPKNNSYFVEELGRLGVRVDLARTTSEGLSKFNLVVGGTALLSRTWVAEKTVKTILGLASIC